MSVDDEDSCLHFLVEVFLYVRGGAGSEALIDFVCGFFSFSSVPALFSLSLKVKLIPMTCSPSDSNTTAIHRH